MKVEWYRSATTGIISKDETSILTDPWISDGAFLGSWYHFPKLEGFEFDALVEKRWDAIYVSHLHADHFDRKLVAAIAKKQPQTICVIPKFPNKWLKRAIENCGFKGERLVEVESGKTLRVGGIRLTIFRADHCDPLTCGVSIPCHQSDARIASIDSLALFEADGQRILNANDALAVSTVSAAFSKIGHVDLLLGHYGGAGPYPQCFPEIDDNLKKVEAARSANIFLERLALATRLLKAKYVIPYAGQYLLGGRLSELNKFRSVVSLSEAASFLGAKTTAKPITMKPFAFFDIGSGKVSEEWEEPSEKEISDYQMEIRFKEYPYERSRSTWKTPYEDLENALNQVKKEYERRLSVEKNKTNHRLSIETGEISGYLQFNDKLCDVTVLNSKLPPMVESETRISCDTNLLRGIIQRPAKYKGFTQYHFNQAEIGSHFTWKRSGEYDPIVSLLNFMQTP